MDDSVSIRRSGRRKIRPLKYWDFEVEDDFMVHADITYNISQLTRSCILDSHNATTLSRTKAASHDSSHYFVGTRREASKCSQISNRRRKETVKGDKPRSIRDKKVLDDSTSSSSTGEDRRRKVKNEREKEDPRKRTQTSKQSDGMMMRQRAEEPSHSTVKNMKKPSVVQHPRDKALPGKLRVEEASENGKGDDFKNSTTTLHSQTHLEQPSFQNVLSSTVISSSHYTSVQQQQVPHTDLRNVNKIGDGVFKVPLPPAIRRQRKASFITEPTLYSIAEESTANISWEGHTTHVQDCVRMDTAATTINVTGSTTCIENSNNNNKGTNKRSPQKKMQVKSTNSRSSMVVHTERHKEENTLSASTFATSTNETSILRRSSRARTTPLEFWNFETAEVTRLETGEVTVIRHKSDVPLCFSRKPITTKLSCKSNTTNITKTTKPSCNTKVTNTSILPRTVATGKRKPVSCDSPAVYPSQRNNLTSYERRRSGKQGDLNTTPTLSSTLKRRRLCSPGCSNLSPPLTQETEEGVKEEVRAHLEKEKGLVTPKAKVTSFENLSFTPVETQHYKCYLATSLRNEQQDVYTGFIFLERGQLIWNTTKCTSFYVIEGVGTMQVAENDKKVSTVCLRAAGNTCITKGKKVLLKKDGRCYMLKIFVVLWDSSKSENDLNVTQE